MKKLTVKLFFVFVLLNLLFGCQTNSEQKREDIKSMPFNKERWNNDDAGMRWAFRPGMASYLVNKKILIGKTRNEIFEILGKIKPNEWDDKNIVKYELEVVFESGIGGDIDPIAIETLHIFFDKNDKVVNAQIPLINKNR